MDKLIKVLIKDLEKDIEKYYDDYGTIEHRLEETFDKMLNILKVMNGQMPFEEWYLEEILKGE